MTGIILNSIQAKFPDNPRIACELAEYYIGLDQWDLAILAVESLSRKDQNNLRAQHLKARCQMHQGEFAKAVTILTQCSLINPHSIDRLLDLGKALMQTGKFRDALASFEMAIDLDADCREARLGQLQCKHSNASNTR